jgi:hypothetical protein
MAATITDSTEVTNFLMVCPSPSGVAEAIHALYYLPQNYRLVVLAQVAAQEENWAASDMMSRVEFKNDTGLSKGASPFSSAPMVVLSSGENTIENTGENRFAVSADSPEAIASAILEIARLPRALSREIHQYA